MYDMYDSKCSTHLQVTNDLGESLFKKDNRQSPWIHLIYMQYATNTMKQCLLPQNMARVAEITGSFSLYEIVS